MTTPPTLRGRAGRLAFLIDTADYFAAFADAIAQARQSIVIIGWEIDSGIKL
jgi:phospholipase D1/2